MLLSFSACQQDPLTTLEDASLQIKPKIHSDSEPFEIGGITLGTSVMDVKLRMGPPLTIKPERMICEDNITCETWGYEDTWVYFYDGKVDGMGTKSSLMCLFDDVCPNQSIKDVFAYMGETKIWPATSDKPPLLNYYSKKHNTCWLRVSLNSEKDTIEELRLVCQP